MRREHAEQGAAAILVAASLVLLLGMAAVTLDLSAGWNERRQDQTTSDLAAVAGAISFGDNSAVVDQVLTVARDNLTATYTDAEWEALWEGCTDPDRSAAFVPLPEPSSWGGGVLDCISLSPSFLRVKLPVQETPTTFGRILGVISLQTDAYTVVTVWPVGGGGALPFAVRANAPMGEICLDTGPGGTSQEPCTGPEAGSFGNIAPPQFGNPFLNTQPECDKQTSSNNHVPEAIAMGVDHILWAFPAEGWNAPPFNGNRSASPNTKTVLDSAVNMDLCNEVTSGGTVVAQPADGVPINGVVVDTGNSVKADVTEGLVSDTVFPDGQPGRLRRSSNTIDVMNGNEAWPLDNTPLWDHLLSPGAGVAYDGFYAPESCDPKEFTGTLEDKVAQMRTCLQDYGAGNFTGQIFGDSIMQSPRFGVAPQLWHDNLGNGLSYRPVEKFVTLYLAGVWFDLKSGPTKVFYPGETGSQWCPVKKKGKCSTINEVEQVSAWLLSPNMLSDTARSTYPALSENFEVTIYE